ncbi:E1-E2 ATPase-domain-containing protein [Gigaspora rosea]|uniref:E1-E2 ATPase-domain-containing protein n=1 Tax=Gigaspora rosea TaxID=44941 RepID=A0A397TWE4_9GLOM|nr:E1-E2 ATPase-domain-containing protein [Gigaspora rosea]
MSNQKDAFSIFLVCIIDGHLSTVSATELVPGDLVRFGVGDRVPADAVNLEIDESNLTGETKPRKKTIDVIPSETNYVESIQERKNIGLMGTLVRNGHGSGIVVGTGNKGINLTMAAIPKGLPIVVAVTLGLGALRMAKKNAIIKKLPSVETLGSVNVICVDEKLARGICTVAIDEYRKKFGQATDVALLDCLIKINMEDEIMGTHKPPLDVPAKESVMRHVTAMSTLGLRVLAMASGSNNNKLTFAIRELIGGGVKVVMVTGDSDQTALSIARKLGIPINPSNHSNCLTGADIEAMSSEDLRSVIGSITVFARTAPKHKMAIIQALSRFSIQIKVPV